jgi:hypothetical protein
MAWITENWIVIFVGLALLVGIFFFLRYLNSLKSSRNGEKIPLDSDEAITVLVRALEEVVHQVTDQNLNRAECKMVALGMLAIMASEEISVNKLISNDELFVKVMVKSMAILAEKGVIG